MQLFWKQVWQFLQKLNRVLYNPAILRPGICLREVRINVHTETCRHILTAIPQCLQSRKPQNGHQREGNPEAQSDQAADRGERDGHCLKGKKPATGCFLQRFLSVRFLGRPDGDGKQIRGCLRPGWVVVTGA